MLRPVLGSTWVRGAAGGGFGVSKAFSGGKSQRARGRGIWGDTRPPRNQFGAGAGGEGSGCRSRAWGGGGGSQDVGGKKH